MRLLTLLVGVIGVVGAASAGDTEFNNINRYDSSDYAAKLFYNVQFGGHQAVQPQSSLSFQVNNERASQFGAPAIFRTDFGSSGITRFALNGVDLRSVMLASQAREGNFFASLTGSDIVGLVAVSVAVIASVNVVAGGGDTNNPSGTGSSGN